MIKKLLLIVAILLLAITGFVNASTDISGIGTISVDTVWTGGGSPYILTEQDLTIAAGATLTIEAGVIIKIKQGDRNWTKTSNGNYPLTYKGVKKGNIIVNGTLVTQGTSSNKVIFTSRRDDSEAVVGDWGRIIFNESNSNNSILNYTDIKYARYEEGQKYKGSRYSSMRITYYEYSGIYFINSSATIQNSTTSEIGADYGINIDGGSPTIENNTISNGITIKGGTPTIENNTINNGTIGIYMSNSNATITENLIENYTDWGVKASNSSGIISDNIVKNNTNGIWIDRGTINLNINEIKDNTGIGLKYYPTSGYNLNANEITYNGTAIICKTLDIAKLGDTNTINNNIINTLIVDQLITNENNITISSNRFDYIKITSDTIIPAGKIINIAAGSIIKISDNKNIDVQGILKTLGTSSDRVTITSASSSPAKGKWKWLKFNESGSNGSELNYTDIEYAGGETTGVRFYNSNASMDNCTVSNNNNYGVYVGGTTSAPTITNSTISNNLNGMYINGSDSANIDHNSITGNTTWGIYIVSAYDNFTNNTISSNGKGVRSFTLDIAKNGDTNIISGNTKNFLYVDYFNIRGTTRTINHDRFGSIIININSTLAVGKVLNIEAGTIIKAANNITLTIQGILNTQGTSSDKVIFTSINDSIGGTTGTDSPHVGDWRRIEIKNAGSNSTVIDYTEIKYSGVTISHNDYSGITLTDTNATIQNSTIGNIGNIGIKISGGAPTISNNTLSNIVSTYSGHKTYGIITSNSDANITNNDIQGATGYGLSISGSSPTIENNTISNNERGVYYAPIDYTKFSNNIISDNVYAIRTSKLDFTMDGSNDQTNTFSNNTNNFLYVQQFNLSVETATIDNGSFPSIIIEGNTGLAASKKLTLVPGTIVKVINNLDISIAGTLSAVGTSANKITFTSVNDHTVGGDTGTGTPASGNWKTIGISGATSNSTILDYTEIRYSGYTTNPAIYLNNTNATIQNSIIENIENIAIKISGGTPTIDNNAISNVSATADKYGITTDNSNAIITNNDIQDTTYGLSIVGATPTIEYNTISNNDWGVYLASTDYTKFKNNTISNNTNPIKTQKLDFTMDGGNDDTNTFNNNTSNFLYVEQFDINPNTATIDNGIFDSIIITSNTGLLAGKTLTITPGTIFKVSNNVTLNIYGTLTAIGTESNKITFTSVNDNTIGGSTGTGTPTTSIWGGLKFWNNTSTNSELNYTTIEYATYGVRHRNYTNVSVENSLITHSSTAIRVEKGSPTIENNTISNSTYGLKLNTGTATVINNIIENNTNGIYTNVTTDNHIISSNLIRGNTNYGIDGSHGGIGTMINNIFENNSKAVYMENLDFVLDGSDANNLSGNDNKSYYVKDFNIDGTSATVDLGIYDDITLVTDTGLTSGKTLNINPGTIIKVINDKYITIYGTLNAIGTEDNKIIFTSINDHYIGGENGTGTPAASNWKAIRFLNTSSNSSKLEQTIVKYSDYGIQIKTSNISVNKTISTKNRYGMTIGAGTPTINRTTIANNTTGLRITLTSSNPTIENTIIARNSDKGIRKVSGTPTFKYSLIGGNTNSDATGVTMDDTNIVGPDPMFVDESSYDLLDGSLAINKADPTLGIHPVSNNRYDIGVIESLGNSRYLYKNFTANISNVGSRSLSYEWEFLDEPTEGETIPTIYGPTGTFNTDGEIGCSSILTKLGTYRIRLTIKSGSTIVGQGDKVFHIVESINN